MAKQFGEVGLRGQIGGIVFYKGAEGFLAKGESSLDRARVLKDPKFERSRKASAAFGHAAKSAGLLRRAMGGHAKQVAETRMSGRLNKMMYDIIKSDSSTAFKDEQRVYRGDLSMLKGFSWHKDRVLKNVLKTGYTVDLNKSRGALEVQLDAFVPKTALKGPAGATHFEVFAVGAVLDFEHVKDHSNQANGGIMPYSWNRTAAITLSCAVGRHNFPLVLGLGLQFYQEVGGKMERLVEGGYFEIVGVEQ